MNNAFEDQVQKTIKRSETTRNYIFDLTATLKLSGKSTYEKTPERSDSDIVFK